MAPGGVASTATINEANQQEAVAACLERLRRAAGHFQAKRLAFEIRDVGFTPAGTLGTLQLLVRWIYERAVMDPARFAAPCAALCFSLTPILPTFKPPGALTSAAKAKRIDFRQTLLNLCQREFEAACRAAIVDTSTPCGELKQASSLNGSLHFLAYLYLHNLITDRIMLSCVATVASGMLEGTGGDCGGKPISGRNVPLRIESLVRALLISGRQLDESLAEQYRPMLDGLYSQLALCKAQAAASELSRDVQTSLERLLELRAGRWANGNACMQDVVTAMAHVNGTNNEASGAAVATAAAAAATKLGKSAGLVTVHRSSGRLVLAAPSATTPVSPIAASSQGGSRILSAGGLSESGVLNTGLTAALRRQALAGSSSNSLLSRPSSISQNLEGLWELSPDTYNDVRGQLLSQPVGSSPATLEAMADELIESAIAASGGDPDCPCWSAQCGVSDAVVAGTTIADAKFAELMQQQWEKQFTTCEIYLRLCMDALQQMSAATPSPASAVPAAAVSEMRTSASGAAGAARAAICNGSAEPVVPSTANGNGSAGSISPTVTVFGDTGRAFRRALLSAAQTHFERCLAALLPTPLSPGPDVPQPGQMVSEPCSSMTADGNTAATRHAWGDMPVVAPDIAAALPRARGVCHLLLGLLRNGILTPRILLHCAAALVDGAATGSLPCLQCACILLVGAGKQSSGFKMAEAAAFESLLKRLLGPTETDASSSDGSGAAADSTNTTCKNTSTVGGCSSSSHHKPVDVGFEPSQEVQRRFLGWLMAHVQLKQ